MHAWIAGLVAALAAAYPIVVYLTLDSLPMSVLGGLLLVLAGTRALALRRRPREPALLATGLAVMAGAGAYTVVTQSELGVRFYPVLMSLGVLAVFAASLASPRPMVERFARLIHRDLSAAARMYLRRVTLVWCVFLTVNAAIALWTALFASWPVWTLYNGLISYLLIGALLLGEFLVRQRYMAQVHAGATAD